MSNIASLNDLRKKEEDESKRQELYSGGIDNRGGGSGLAVIGPEGSRGGAGGGGGGLFDNIVARAQQPSDLPPPSTSAGSSNSRRISLYRNGFTVDDGPLRDLTSPESRAFITSLENGEVPRELATASGSNLDVALDDRRGEDYVAPPQPAYVAFSGPATTLGSSSGGSASTGAAVFTEEMTSSVEVAAVDDSKPTTLLQVKTTQGKKIRLKINQDSTVLQLAAVIVRDSGAGGVPSSFILSAGFPPQDVQDGSISIKDAGLVGAAITVKAP